MMDNKVREAQWKKGVHTDADNKRWPLENMRLTHLKSTIKTFSHLDTRPLEKELRRRQAEQTKRSFKRVLKHLKLGSKQQTETKKERQLKNAAKSAHSALVAYIDLL